MFNNKKIIIKDYKYNTNIIDNINYKSKYLGAKIEL